MKPLRSLFLGSVVLVTALASPAHADFSGVYDLTPPDPAVYSIAGSQTFGTWSSTETHVYSEQFDEPVYTLDDQQAPAALTLSFRSPAGSTEVDEDFSHIAPASGPLSFTYIASVGSEGSIYLFVNGTQTPLNGSGSVSDVALAAGDTFGFHVDAEDGYTSSLIISGFSAPVPEPSSWALLGVGAACMGVVTGRRRGVRV